MMTVTKVMRMLNISKTIARKRIKLVRTVKLIEFHDYCIVVNTIATRKE